MASKQPSHTTQTTKVELPAWVDAAAQENYNLAKEISTQPFMQYQGERVGSMNSDTQAFINQLKGKIGSGDTDKILTDIASGNTNAAGLMDKYQNPFTQDVIDKTLSSMTDQRTKALMSNSDAATKAGAFGGSRHGVVDAVTTAESLKDMGLLESQLRSSGYDKSLAAAQQEIADRMSGATSANTTRNQNLAALLQTGLTEKADRQARIDADIAKFNEPRDRQLEDLNLRLSALGMSPYGKSESTQKTSQGGSSGTDIGQLGLGIFSLLLGLSDDNEKTDKKKLGKVPGSDLDLYAFRYKGDPKTYPKSVGVMASDIEKKMPEAVHKINGTRVIDYGMLGQAVKNGRA